MLPKDFKLEFNPTVFTSRSDTFADIAKEIVPQNTFAWYYSSKLNAQHEQINVFSEKDRACLKKDLESGLFDKGIEQTTPRLSHALKRLRSKGYYAGTFSDLISKTDAFLPLKDNFLSSLSMAITAGTGEFAWEDVKIEDELWYCAIECAMFALHPKQFHDPDVYFAAYLENDLWLIYAYALLLSYSSAFTFYKREYDKQEKEKSAKEKPIAPDQPVPEPQTDPAEVDRLRERIKELESDLANEKRRSNRTIRKLEHEVESLRDSENKKLDSLREQNAQLIEFILHPEAEDIVEEMPQDELSQPKEDPRSFDHPLPEQRVLFLGGHIDMVKKIRAVHPDWLFITDNNFNLKSMASVDVIFFWTAHASHKLQQRVFSDLPNIPPIVYVTATNLDRLELEMLEGYNDIFNS